MKADVARIQTEYNSYQLLSPFIGLPVNRK